MFAADSDTVALMIAEQIRQNGERELEVDSGDSIDVHEVVPYGIGMTPAEVVNVVRAARNALILTKIKQCYELAKELDRIAWILEHREERPFDVSSYDPARFMLAAETLLAGGVP